MKKTISICLCLIFLPLHAANVTQISRYAAVGNKPLPAQINPLKSIQQVHFPTSIQTIGDAVQHWLVYSGYHLVPAEKQNPGLKKILEQPLPQVDRNLGPLTIEDGLAILVGRNLFSLTHDDLAREVNFTLIKRRK
ncbi:hypothetical protein E3983_10080 [Legionella israelensis]|uniref:Integrating conjugative element protein PilL, PFGI-1 class n=1 Tax=Legionella israelensis TaxID=454 RepID=A0AAX1EHR1_9GAMM|nr:hypothetical protein [Legionella israelensis]QBR84681.1 hypothetical protein E3983_10080 [Legionella israelensis]